MIAVYLAMLETDVDRDKFMKLYESYEKNVTLNGEKKISAGSDITVANGEKAPSSILYTDVAGGKTNYLPIRAISELLGISILQIRLRPSTKEEKPLSQLIVSISPSKSFFPELLILSAKLTYL